MTLFAALLAHDLWIFGTNGHDLIGSDAIPCTDPPCLTMELVVSGHIAKAIGAAIIFAAIGAIWVTGAVRLGITAVFWISHYLWSLIGIASGYRGNFGASWTWWQPFTELLWMPMLTPTLMIAGLGTCLGLDRLGRAVRAAS